jgi:hypothetical protein
MAIGGVGLVVAGISLGVIGAALIAPAMFAFGARMIVKTTDNFTDKFEEASKTVGTITGTLHRAFNEAKKAGVDEFKRR